MPPEDEPQRDAEDNSQDVEESLVQPADNPETLRLQVEAMSKEIQSLQNALTKVNHESTARRHALNEAEQERQRILAEQGEYRQLYEEAQSKIEQLKPVQERYQAMIEDIAASNQQRVENLPEHIRVIVPTNYTPDQLQRWLDAAEPVLKTPSPANIDIGVRSTGDGKTLKISREDREMAERLGLDPQEYARQRHVIYQERHDK